MIYNLHYLFWILFKVFRGLRRSDVGKDQMLLIKNRKRSLVRQIGLAIRTHGCYKTELHFFYQVGRFCWNFHTDLYWIKKMTIPMMTPSATIIFRLCFMR